MRLFHRYEQIRELKSSLVVDSKWQHKNAGIYFKVIEVLNEDGIYKGEVTNQFHSFMCSSTLGPYHANFVYFFEHWRRVG